MVAAILLSIGTYFLGIAETSPPTPTNHSRRRRPKASPIGGEHRWLGRAGDASFGLLQELSKKGAASHGRKLVYKTNFRGLLRREIHQDFLLNQPGPMWRRSFFG